MNPDRALFDQSLEQVRGTSAIRTKIVRYFGGVNLQNGHDGLKKIAHREGIELQDLPVGEFVIFVNKKQNALKMYSQGHIIAHLRMPGGARINPDTIRLLPRFFSGRAIAYNAALDVVIRREFGVRN